MQPNLCGIQLNPDLCFILIRECIRNGKPICLPYSGDDVGNALQIYESEFVLDAVCDDKSYYVCFKGADYKAVVYVNDRCVGTHEGFFAPFEFDFTKQARPGINTLVVAVENDYIPFGNSAINLVEKFSNILVTRSFSKGWGMAGVRLGYGVASNESDMLEQLQKLVLPFNSNAIARTLAEAALKAKLEHPEDPFGIWPVIRNKQRLLDKIEQYNIKYNKKLSVAETHFSTPIIMLYYQNGGEEFNLQSYLMQYGILAVSCETYVGVGKHAVRIMLPDSEKMPLLLELMEQAVSNLP